MGRAERNVSLLWAALGRFCHWQWSLPCSSNVYVAITIKSFGGGVDWRRGPGSCVAHTCWEPLSKCRQTPRTAHVWRIRDYRPWRCSFLLEMCQVLARELFQGLVRLPVVLDRQSQPRIEILGTTTFSKNVGTFSLGHFVGEKCLENLYVCVGF